MTFIAMVSMEDCVVLAADRETFSIYEDGSSERSGDLDRKITETADGFITASGLVELIDPVKRRFECELPQCPDHMLAIIADEQRRLTHRDSTFAQVWIPKSTWKLSVRMSRGVTAAFYDPKTHTLRGLSPGLAMMTFPGVVAVQEQKYVNSFFPEGRFLRPSESEVTEVIEQILQAVTFMRQCGRPVSQKIDFALHCGDEKSQIALLAS